MQIKLRVKLDTSDNLTLAVDGWTDALKRSIFAFVVQFKDRTTRLLETREASLDKHTGEFMAGAGCMLCNVYATILSSAVLTGT